MSSQLKIPVIFIIFFQLSCFGKNTAEGLPQNLEKILSSQRTIWSIEFLSSSEIIFSEREGGLKVLDLKTNKLTVIKNLPPMYDTWQGGLMDLALDPDFKNNKTLFFTYSKDFKSKGQTTALARATLEGNQLKNVKDLFIALPIVDSNRHFGSRIEIDKSGLIYLSVGDRGNRKFSQRLDVHLGKVLRIDKTGKAPKDNPFVGQKGAQPEIWSYGHRNPQGMDIHPLTGKIWIHEHGPRGGDEINMVKKGKNYGWPVVTHGREYYGPKISKLTEKPGMESPVKVYVPSIAPCGLTIYSGKVHKNLKGMFILGALKSPHLNVVQMNGDKPVKEKRLFSELSERVRDVKEGPLGNLYFSTDSGNIYKFKDSQKSKNASLQ